MRCGYDVHCVGIYFSMELKGYYFNITCIILTGCYNLFAIKVICAAFIVNIQLENYPYSVIKSQNSISNFRCIKYQICYIKRYLFMHI